jgi:hypothetical protein
MAIAATFYCCAMACGHEAATAQGAAGIAGTQLIFFSFS